MRTRRLTVLLAWTLLASLPIAHGTVVASFNIESFSLERLASMTKQELEARFDEFVRMVRV